MISVGTATYREDFGISEESLNTCLSHEPHPSEDLNGFPSHRLQRHQY